MGDNHACVALLLDRGARVDVVDTQRQGALHKAAECASKRVVSRPDCYGGLEEGNVARGRGN